MATLPLFPLGTVLMPGARLPLQIFEPPLKLRVSRVGMVWHDSLHEDPAQRWLRAAVAEVCAGL